jgi:hypothetical protein
VRKAADEAARLPADDYHRLMMVVDSTLNIIAAFKNTVRPHRPFGVARARPADRLAEV